MVGTMYCRGSNEDGCTPWNPDITHKKMDQNVMQIWQNNDYELKSLKSILNHSLFTSPYLESWHDANLYALMIKLTSKGC